MSTYAQQQYSGKILRILRDSPHWIVLRPVPDDHGPDIGISRDHFTMKWRYYNGPIPTAPQQMQQFVFGEKAADEPMGAQPVEKRKRGRPRKQPVPA